MLFVSYMCDGTWFVAVGGGNIFGAVSTVKGRGGIAGPYETYGIVLGPNATEPAKRWGNISHFSGRYVDQLAPFALPDGRLAAFVGENHLMATATSPRGPWIVEEGSGAAGLAAIGTNRSAYNENPVVSTVRSATGSVVYVAVFDTVYNEHEGFGLSTSRDGQHWSKGVDVALPGGCRTPLGVIDEGDGFATMLFTRRYTDCRNRTALPPNGADAILPTSCGNVHAARLKLAFV